MNTMKRASLLFSFFFPGLLLFQISPTFAQNPGFEQVEDQFIEECLTQSLPPGLPRLSAALRARYCGCYFDRISNSFTFDEFQEIDSAIRQNPENIKTFDPQVLQIFENSVQQCYGEAIGQVDPGAQQEADAIAQLETELDRLLQSGKLGRASEIAEEIVEKKRIGKENATVASH